MTTQLLKTLLENEALDREFELDTYRDIIRACSGGNVRNFDTTVLDFLLFLYFRGNHSIQLGKSNGMFSLDYIMKNGFPEDAMDFFKRIPLRDFPSQIASFSPDGKTIEVLSFKYQSECLNLMAYEGSPEYPQQLPKFHIKKCEAELVTMLRQDNITFGHCEEIYVAPLPENFRDIQKIANTRLFEKIDVVTISGATLEEMIQRHQLVDLLKPCLVRARIDHNTEFNFDRNWSSVKKRENVKRAFNRYKDEYLDEHGTEEYAIRHVLVEEGFPEYAED